MSPMSAACSVAQAASALDEGLGQCLCYLIGIDDAAFAQSTMRQGTATKMLDTPTVTEPREFDNAYARRADVYPQQRDYTLAGEPAQTLTPA